jgi:hypothetical protein
MIDDGPDGSALALVIWLPSFSDAQPPLQELRCVLELYALPDTINARALERFGMEVVTRNVKADEDESVCLYFDFDDDFSEASEWRDDVEKRAAQIIAANGGTVA